MAKERDKQTGDRSAAFTPQNGACFPELGAEAVYRLEVENFPVLVAQDCRGGNLFER